MWSSVIVEDERSKYRQVAADLTSRIRDGEYPPGKVLPSLAQLCERYAVSQITVRQAVRLLVEQGLVRTVPGKGIVATSGNGRETQRVGRRVGVLLPTIPAWSALYHTLFEELHDLRDEILLKPLPVTADFTSQPERALFELMALRATCGGGLVLFGDQLLVETFLQERQPDEVVVCLENSNGIPPTVPMVSTDNFGGMFALTRHLLALGHTSVAYLDYRVLRDPKDKMRPGTKYERRFAGYLAALHAAGLAPCMPRDLLEALLFDSPEPEELARLARRRECPTALICFNDQLAGNVHERLTGAEVLVPEEISLAGYDNASDLRGGQWLTSLDQNGPELARQLARLLHEERERLHRRREATGVRILVPPVLHPRDSTAPPPA